MKITVIGSGYVGLVSGACFADLGNDVVCLDIDEKKIAQLRGGGIPIYEPGLLPLISHNVAAGRLKFTTDVEEGAAHGDVQFIAVGTPSDQDGSADMRYVIAAARNIGRSMNEYRVIVNKQTSAHDLIHGYLPPGWSVEQWQAAAADPAQHAELSAAAAQGCAMHVRAMLQFQAMGIPTVDYGNNIRQVALDHGVKNAFDFPGFVPAYIRPLFCRGKGPFRWVALSGDPEDIRKTDAKMKELFPEDAHLHRWLDMAQERIAFQGLPARICWIGLGERHRAGLAFNEMVKSGELKAPIVIGRDHLDSGSVASPNRETESMKDGSDAVSDWPLLNALLNTAGGATWVSLHHGGGVGMGYSQHAGVVIVCDGTDAAAKRIERVLWNDPATGVMRHADAGYDEAVQCAREQGLKLPMVAAL